MTRRVRFIKQNKGMTLVEIMTGFAILAVLMAVSLTIMLFATNALNKESERDRMKMSGDEMYQAVSGKLKFATHLELRPEGADPDAAKYENVFYIEAGRLYAGPKGGPYTPYYADSVYQDTSVALTAAVEADTLLSLGLTFERPGADRPVYETASAFKVINLLAGTENQKIEGQGAYNNPVISYDGVPYMQDVPSGDDPPYTGEDPYTVAKYPEGKEAEIIHITDPTEEWDVKKGDIVEYEGQLWQAVESFHYGGDMNWMPSRPNHKWKSLEEDWRTVNAGNSGKSAYEYHDVVGYNRRYYMSVKPNYLNTYEPTKVAGVWEEVFWFKEKATAAEPMLGWSTTPAPDYTCALDVYQ